MGHAKVETTLRIYSHVISKEVFEDTANTLEFAFQEIAI